MTLRNWTKLVIDTTCAEGEMSVGQFQRHLVNCNPWPGDPPAIEPLCRVLKKLGVDSDPLPFRPRTLAEMPDADTGPAGAYRRFLEARNDVP